MRRSWLLSILLFSISCSKPLPELLDFDQQVWKDDPKGCKGDREQYNSPLFVQRNLLKGLSEVDLVTLLGQPDKTDLSEHHEKFYSYYMTPGPECNGASAFSVLEVRFNATGVSKEVTIYIEQSK
jgi:hypothetical protein